MLHAAERTGPPLFALQFLRWVREQRPDWQLSTLFLAEGDFTDPFRELGSVVVRPVTPPAGPGWVGTRRLDRSIRRRLRALGPVDLAHVHCAGSMRVVPVLPDAPVLCHVHELSVGLDYHLNRGAREHFTDASHYVAVSDGVRDEVLARFPVDPAAIERQWGFVDRRRLPSTRADDLPATDPAARFLVVASGVRNWRKAPELFLRTAHLARTLHPEVPWQFLWIGGRDGGALQREVDAAGLGDVVQVVDHVDDPLGRIAAADVFLLSAREDAFPLVCVEAAALGRPIVSFDSGGAAELIAAADCGVVVPFPDVAGVVTALHELAVDDSTRRRLGDAAASFAAEHLTLDVAGPRLLATVEGRDGATVTAGHSRHVVLATADASGNDGNDRLLLLARWLQRRGVTVELVCLGGGPERAAFQRAAPVLVVDELRRRGVARLPHLLGAGRVAEGIKTLRLRRWLARRADATFYLHHPRAASLLRYAPTPPARIVGSLPDHAWTPDAMRPEDRASLAAADAWIISDAAQRDLLDTRVPVVEFGTVVDPDDLPEVVPGEPARGHVVLLSGNDPWVTPDHAVELAWQLHRHDPAVAVRWLAADDRAAWLVAHDLAQAALPPNVECVRADDPGVLTGAAIVVRAAADAGGTPVLIAAALAGLPVRGWGLGPLVGLESAEPLDVEGLVADIVSLRADPTLARAAGARAVAAVEHLDLERRASAVLAVLAAEDG